MLHLITAISVAIVEKRFRIEFEFRFRVGENDEGM